MPFLPYPPNGTTEAVNVLNQDVQILHNIVHGSELVDIPTENGDVPTIAKLIKEVEDAVLEVGYIPSGTFSAGATITQINQVLSDGTSYWRWDGALPKTVTAGSVPTPTGVGSWILINDGGLRDALAAADSTVLVANIPANIIADKVSAQVSTIDFSLTNNNADGLRAAKLNAPQSNPTYYGSSEYINGTDDTRGIFNYANFAGQTAGSSAPIAFTYHNYTDGRNLQIDNVGSGTIVTLKNARNPTRRPDKASDYVGSGNFIDFLRDDGAGATIWEAFINKDMKIVWRFRPMVFNQGKTDTATFAFQDSVDTRHTYVHELRQSGQQVMYTKDTGSIFSYELGADRTTFKINAAGAGQWVELGSGSGQVVIASGSTLWGAGRLNLNATTDGIECKKPLILAKYSTGVLPVLPDSDRALVFDTTVNKVKVWMGTASGWVVLGT